MIPNDDELMLQLMEPRYELPDQKWERKLDERAKDEQRMNQNQP